MCRAGGPKSRRRRHAADTGYPARLLCGISRIVTALVGRCILLSKFCCDLSFRAAILKALSEAEALKKPSVSETARRRRCRL